VSMHSGMHRSVTAAHSLTRQPHELQRQPPGGRRTTVPRLSWNPCRLCRTLCWTGGRPPIVPRMLRALRMSARAPKAAYLPAGESTQGHHDNVSDGPRAILPLRSHLRSAYSLPRSLLPMRKSHLRLGTDAATAYSSCDGRADGVLKGYSRGAGSAQLWKRRAAHRARARRTHT
jgi:hypothetical protein